MLVLIILDCIIRWYTLKFPHSRCNIYYHNFIFYQATGMDQWTFLCMKVSSERQAENTEAPQPSYCTIFNQWHVNQFNCFIIDIFLDYRHCEVCITDNCNCCFIWLVLFLLYFSTQWFFKLRSLSWLLFPTKGRIDV